MPKPRTPTPKTQGDPWWLILLKILAYALGLIIAGYTTASAATLLIT